MTLWGDDNVCTNLPSDWNDRAQSIMVNEEDQLYSDSVICSFYIDINCGGASLTGTHQTSEDTIYDSWDLQSSNSQFNKAISSFKCWLNSPIDYCTVNGAIVPCYSTNNWE